MSYKVEKEWEHEGLKCVVIALDRGHRCGYVGVDSKHPLFSLNYDSNIPPELLHKWKQIAENEPAGKRGIIDLLCYDSENPRVGIIFNVHGSITYSGGGKDSKYPIESDLWWFGFDCAHAGDAKDVTIMSIEHYKIEHYKIEHEMSLKYGKDSGRVRTLYYCIEECNRLAEQLMEVIK